LELAVLASVRQGDDAALDRNYAQLHPYYTDIRGALPPSQQEPLLQGLRLLALLVQNRIAEFHTALECIPDEVLSTPEVSQICDLEARLMEGGYNKALAARSSPASPYYIPLLERLASTVRDEVASCSEAAYESLSGAAAARMLRFDSEAELAAYCQARGWTMRDGRVDLKAVRERGKAANGGEKFESGKALAAEIVEHCLTYTKELERIV
jgi:26S proteasome regulatory subunit N12